MKTVRGCLLNMRVASHVPSDNYDWKCGNGASTHIRLHFGPNSACKLLLRYQNDGKGGVMSGGTDSANEFRVV